MNESLTELSISQVVIDSFIENLPKNNFRMKTKVYLLLVIFIFGGTMVRANNDTLQLSEEMMQLMIAEYIDSIEQTLNYQTEGTVNLKNIAAIQIPEGFKYLDGAGSDKVLTEIWGNPPREDKSLGMLMPEDATVMSDSAFFIDITYTNDGYVDDADAKKIDSDDMLSDMQKEAKETNKLRAEMGYESVELVGWAAPPYYDAENKKLHWAKELKFGDAEINTLNYNIRVLGRKGYLQLNAISDVGVLPQVNASIQPILSSVNFKSGNTYADFNPKMDKVAAYGIGGLIAGKVLAKAGILAKLGILLAKFWKVIAIAVIAFGAGIRKIFSGRSAG